jgi:hypothetical protein
MTIEQLAKRLITVEQAAAEHGVSRQCIWIWRKTGLRMPDGQRRKLPAVTIAGRMLIDREVLAKFVAGTAAA